MMKKQIELSLLVSLIQFSFAFSQAASWVSLEFKSFAQFKIPEDVELIDSSNTIVYISRNYFQTLQASKARIPNLKVADEFSLNKYYEMSIELFNRFHSLDTFKVEKIIVNRLSGRILTGRKSFEGGADQVFKSMMFLVKNDMYTFSSIYFDDVDEQSNSKRFFNNIRLTSSLSSKNQYNANFLEILNYKRIVATVLLFGVFVFCIWYFFTNKRRSL